MKNNFDKRITPRRVLTVFVLVAGFFFQTHSLLAATLSISPSEGTYSIGQTLTVNVLLTSTDQSANAVSGTLSFDASRLSIKNVSITNSVVNFWAEQPSFSNTGEDVNFAGVILNPGYLGSSGKVLSITFTPKKSGPASFTFADAEVLANDGKGTSILNGTTGASFVFAKPDSSPPVISSSDLGANPFTLTQQKRDDPTDPVVTFSFNNNSSEAIDHYEFSIDNAQPVSVTGSSYTTGTLSPGVHGVAVTGVYADQKTFTDTDTIIIDPIPAPSIVRYSQEISSDQYFVVEASSTPRTALVFTLTDSSGHAVTQQTRVGSGGQTTFIWPTKLSAGFYDLQAQAINSEGADSLLTPSVQVVVHDSFYVVWGKKAILYLGITVILFVLLILLALLCLYLYRTLQGFRQKTLGSLHRSFITLHHDVKEHIDLLNSAKTKRALTEEEERFVEKVAKDLSETEKAITGGLKNWLK